MSNNNLYINEILSHDLGEDASEGWKMLYVSVGMLTVTKEDAVYKLTAGDIILFAPEEFYNICDEAEYILFTFSGGGEFLEELSKKAVSLTDDEIRLIEGIHELVGKPYNSLEAEQSLAMLKLLILLCCEKEALKPCREKNTSVFTFAARILKENIKGNISVNELAERLDISLSNLKRIFLKYTGIGVHEYYSLLKISFAKELLKKGESVTATAELTGFANQAYFSAAFKRVVGKTPKEYCLTKPKEINTSVKKRVNKKADMPSYLL